MDSFATASGQMSNVQSLLLFSELRQLDFYSGIIFWKKVLIGDSLCRLEALNVEVKVRLQRCPVAKHFVQNGAWRGQQTGNPCHTLMKGMCFLLPCQMSGLLCSLVAFGVGIRIRLRRCRAARVESLEDSVEWTCPQNPKMSISWFEYHCCITQLYYILLRS